MTSRGTCKNCALRSAEKSPKKIKKYRGGHVGPRSLTRQASNVKNALLYSLPPGRALGAEKRKRWLSSKTQQLGSPGDHYDFVELNSVHDHQASNHDLARAFKTNMISVAPVESRIGNWLERANICNTGKSIDLQTTLQSQR